VTYAHTTADFLRIRSEWQGLRQLRPLNPVALVAACSLALATAAGQPPRGRAHHTHPYVYERPSVSYEPG
jgi:hypothetical protein